MEVHIQKCQKCGSRNTRNILVRDEQQKVFVQCRDCQSLVARYVLSTGGGGYYHAGKGFESFLRSVEREVGFSSGKELQDQFENLGEEVDQEYEDLKDILGDRYGDELP